MGGGRGGLPPRIPVGLGSGRGGRSGRGRQRDYTPTSWNGYFDEKIEVVPDPESPQRRFNVYQSKSENADSESAVLVLLHGGGYSGLTWAQMAKELTSSVECRILAPDLRGHGDTQFPDSEEHCLDADTLARDVVNVTTHLLSSDANPPVILVGHSMGGALAVHTALTAQIPNLCGLCVIDVVEGTAMDALSSMQSFLRGRPKSFPSLSYAVEWTVRSGHKNVDSARVSVPGQLKAVKTGRCAIHDVESASKAEHRTVETGPEAIQEDVEQDFKEPAKDSKSDEFEWRIDLSATEQYWPGWFQGLSSKFLSVRATKLLVLAGVDRLDRELTVGQMQGAFQMQVLPQAGHAVHEDCPDKVADVLATYLVRNKFSKPLGDFNRTFPAC